MIKITKLDLKTRLKVLNTTSFSTNKNWLKVPKEIDYVVIQYNYGWQFNLQFNIPAFPENVKFVKIL